MQPQWLESQVSGVGVEPAGVHREEPLSAGLGPGAHLQGSREPTTGLELGRAKSQCVFTFISPWRVIMLLRRKYVYGALAGTGLSRGESSRSQVLEGILESGEHWPKEKAEIGCKVTLPAAPTLDLGCGKGARIHGTVTVSHAG